MFAYATPSSASSRSSGCGGRTWRATRWAAASRSSSRAGAPSRSATAISPVGFWTPRERRFCQLSLGLSRDVPAPLRSGVLPLAGSAAGRTLLHGADLRPPLAHPRRGCARSTLEDFWAAPAFSAALAAFDGYLFRAGHELRRARHGRLGQPRPAAALRAPGAARAPRRSPMRAT